MRAWPPATPTQILPSVCPLDCPDACSLEVRVEEGRVVEVGGSRVNPVTAGFICAKVRRFPEHVHGPRRIRYPGVREGRKGEGRFRRVSWDEALNLVVSRMKDLAAAGRGGAHPALLLRRLERIPLAGRGGRPPLSPARRFPARAHRLRGPVGARRDRPLRQDAGNRPAGLPALEARRSLGREPFRLRHPPGALHPGSAEPGSASRRRRPAPDAPGRAGGPAHRAAPGNGPSARPRGHPVALRERARRRRVPLDSRDRSRGAAPAGLSLDARRRGPDGPRPRRGRSSGSRGCTRNRAPRRSGAAGGSSATATAARPLPRCWRCRPWPGSSACAAAATP